MELSDRESHMPTRRRRGNVSLLIPSGSHLPLGIRLQHPALGVFAACDFRSFMINAIQIPLTKCDPEFKLALTAPATLRPQGTRTPVGHSSEGRP
jgi:hypothetical protein